MDSKEIVSSWKKILTGEANEIVKGREKRDDMKNRVDKDWQRNK